MMDNDELLDKVNLLLQNAEAKHRMMLHEYEKKIQDHIKVNLDNIINQTWEINNQAKSQREESLDIEAGRFSESLRCNRLNSRIQNACILYARPTNRYPAKVCVDKVIEIERLCEEHG